MKGRVLAYLFVLGAAGAAFALWQRDPWAGLALFLVAWAALVMERGGA